MATSTALVSLEQYLRTSYKPDADYVDGEIVERNLGEFEHGTVQAAMAGFFWMQRRQWNVHPVTEQRIRVSPTKVRIADLAVLRGDAPREKVTATPPLICIEVLSPEDRMTRAKVVLADCWSMGVKNIWLIDPIYQSAFVFDGDGLHDADPCNLTVAGTEIVLDLTEAFAAITSVRRGS
jgi:Uma2 family endonuclease